MRDHCTARGVTEWPAALDSNFQNDVFKGGAKRQEVKQKFLHEKRWGLTDALKVTSSRKTNEDTQSTSVAL
ncbi:hypothetical protein Naga_101500g2 [Nannochloropsis gaditana]|uniref:Uncharacterized protein n=1 Tax=Nannochloropsis gaditana TaxID=72520 RepID=W7T0A9_9STRA|nr:hypothetical protein Naga_101500g2 [Nannochloropsis gaditana]